MKKVIVVGAGGFGREVIEIFQDINKIMMEWEIIGFVDDDKKLQGSTINGFPVLGDIDWLIANAKSEIACVIAVGNPIIKKKIADKLDLGGIKFVNAIHPTVIMSEFVKIGKDVIICAGSILTVNIKIGNHVLLNLNCTVGHDAIIEDYCSMMTAVKINGNDHLHMGVFIGTGATLINDVSVGCWSILGAGAVVVKDIPENVLAVGIPAKSIKNLGN